MLDLKAAPCIVWPIWCHQCPTIFVLAFKISSCLTGLLSTNPTVRHARKHAPTLSYSSYTAPVGLFPEYLPKSGNENQIQSNKWVIIRLKVHGVCSAENMENLQFAFLSELTLQKWTVKWTCITFSLQNHWFVNGSIIGLTCFGPLAWLWNSVFWGLNVQSVKTDAHALL